MRGTPNQGDFSERHYSSHECGYFVHRNAERRETKMGFSEFGRKKIPTTEAQHWVGIFWCHRGTIIGRRWPVGQSEITSLGTADAPCDHAACWDEIISEQALPELHGLEYFQVPRGRVVRDMVGERTVVYRTTAAGCPFASTILTGPSPTVIVIRSCPTISEPW